MKGEKNIFILIPTFGILIFIGLYVLAASLYPGGSQVDLNSIGFDWYNNFWCNLMSEYGLNGQENPARPIAILAMSVLCSSMILFFFLFAKHFVKNRGWQLIIKISGVLSMVSAVFIFTNYHDILTTILSVFGGMVLIGLIKALHKRKLILFKISGIVCIVLVVINNLMYYNEELILYLPVIQKINFILVLTWTIGLNLKMKNKNAYHS